MWIGSSKRSQTTPVQICSHGFEHNLLETLFFSWNQPIPCAMGTAFQRYGWAGWITMGMFCQTHPLPSMRQRVPRFLAMLLQEPSALPQRDQKLGALEATRIQSSPGPISFLISTFLIFMGPGWLHSVSEEPQIAPQFPQVAKILWRAASPCPSTGFLLLKWGGPRVHTSLCQMSSRSSFQRNPLDEVLLQQGCSSALNCMVASLCLGPQSGTSIGPHSFVHWPPHILTSPWWVVIKCFAFPNFLCKKTSAQRPTKPTLPNHG
jgi:hypothetical protein